MTALFLALAAAESSGDVLSAIYTALSLGFQIRPFVNPDGTTDDSKVVVRTAKGNAKRLDDWRRGCHLCPFPPAQPGAPVMGKTYAFLMFPLATLAEAKMHSGMLDWYASTIGTTVHALLNPPAKEPSPVAKLEAAWRTASENPTDANLAAMRDTAMEYIAHNLKDPAKPFLLRVVYLLGKDK